MRLRVDRAVKRDKILALISRLLISFPLDFVHTIVSGFLCGRLVLNCSVVILVECS